MIIVPSQPTCNIPEILAECSLSVAMFRTFRKHLEKILEGKIFQKVIDEKVVFVLKVCDLIITNIDVLANSSNHEVMFPKYSRIIPRMPISKIFQVYSLEYCKVMKIFLEVRKLKKLFYGC